MLAVARLKVALLLAPFRSLLIHRPDPAKNRVTLTLKFTLPPPAEADTTRRFFAVPRGYGPSGAHALEGAVRYAYPFDYQHEATTLLPDSDFLSLPDHVTQYGPVRTQLLGCTSPNPSKHGFSPVHLAFMIAETLSFQATRQIALPSIPMRYFCSELTI